MSRFHLVGDMLGDSEVSEADCSGAGCAGAVALSELLLMGMDPPQSLTDHLDKASGTELTHLLLLVDKIDSRFFVGGVFIRRSSCPMGAAATYLNQAD